MKIAVPTTQFFPTIGGAQFVVHHLAREWADQGHDVRVMNYTSNNSDLDNLPYSVRKYKILRGSTRFGYHNFPFNWHTTRELKRQLDEFQPDFISAHVGYPMAIWLSNIKPTPKYLITCHGDDLNKFNWGDRSKYNIDKLLVNALNKSEGVIAISTYAHKILEEMGAVPSLILDIPNGVDLKSFKKNVKFDLRTKFDLPNDVKIILSVGREHPTKAFDIGIKSFAKISIKAPKAVYIILGSGVNKWASLAADLGVSKKIIFCDGLYNDELIGAYKTADMFFSPSRGELSPLVVLEALAAGLPQVVTNISGSQDIIESGKNGIVVEPENIEEMANALYQLLIDKSIRAIMSNANLAKSKLYGWDKISRLYIENI